MLGDNDKIIIKCNRLYVYCPRCDEIHSVPLKPHYRDGWTLGQVDFNESLYRGYYPQKPYPMKPSILEWPLMDHCCHTDNAKGKMCAWSCSHYFTTKPIHETINNRFVLMPTMNYYNNGQDQIRLRTVKEWPEKFQPIVKALTT